MRKTVKEGRNVEAEKVVQRRRNEKGRMITGFGADGQQECGCCRVITVYFGCAAVVCRCLSSGLQLRPWRWSGAGLLPPEAPFVFEVSF